MTTNFPYRLWSLAAVLLTVWMLPFSVSPARAQAIAVMVNGEPITDYDIEQRSKLDFLSTHKKPSRQDVINELIDQKVQIKEGKKYGVEPTAADIDQNYAQMSSRMRLTPDQLTKSLAGQGIRADVLKDRIKAEMVWGSLVRGRFKDRLLVGEQDINAAVKAEGGDDPQQADAFEYRMRPVVLVVPKGSPPSAVEAKKKEADELRGRVQSCDEASSLFKSLPNAAIREIVVKTSADMPAVLRKELDDTPIGHLTPPEITKQGVEMVVLCSRKPTTVDTPKRRAARDKLYAAKYEKVSKSYLQEIRREAMIEYPTAKQ